MTHFLFIFSSQFAKVASCLTPNIQRYQFVSSKIYQILKGNKNPLKEERAHKPETRKIASDCSNCQNLTESLSRNRRDRFMNIKLIHRFYQSTIFQKYRLSLKWKSFFHCDLKHTFVQLNTDKNEWVCQQL